ncbi:homoserine kinase [Ktedonospora formicarum]|uniref:Aminoglycoside phosphotransferase domain-containing protein n=1 Tax=Ktedonospora formicarum TaxID=2778364 RepID=A0A8J3HXR5_9CHLR|nr:homoserine kinase [Ktedonospora formicarum]GHO46127.1 hypothetical protein KSX_42900 [Ktedonospora formicarum]
MAAKTMLSEHDLRAILANYHLGELVSFKPLTLGTVQTNCRITTTKGVFVFRYYESRSIGSVLFESNLIRHLKRKNYPCPGLLKNRGGGYVGIFNEKPYAIFEFVEGQHLERPTEIQQKQLIQKVAELQIITKGYKPRKTEYRWNYSVDLARELAHEAVSRIGSVNAEEKLKWFEDELAILQLPRTLPKGVCHCDFHFSNILFKNGEFQALLDFDDANYTFLTYDLATLINPFIPSFEWNTWHQFKPDDNVIDLYSAHSVASEYAHYRALSNSEKRHLFDVYKLSILFDCIWYFERGDVRDFYERRKIGHLNRLGRDAFYDGLFGE